MKPAWAEDFPRLYELYCESDQANEANYFTAFGDVLRMPLARSRYEQLEEELKQLDNIAWKEFKERVLRYVTTRDSRREYNQLFECFNEVKGYLYLKSEGCKEIHFIPEEKNIATPDIRAHRGSSVVLLEVKTINKSEAEIDWLIANSELRDGRMQAKQVLQGLGDPLKHKIAEKISDAKRQLLDYPCKGVKRRIVYLVINLDIPHALDPRNFNELAAYIQLQGDKQIEVMYSCS